MPNDVLAADDHAFRRPTNVTLPEALVRQARAQAIGSIPKRELRTRVASLRDRHDVITKALGQNPRV